MKGWLGGLILAGVGFGVGFFAGERFGRTHAGNDAIEENEALAPASEESSSDVDIAKREGYVPDDQLDADLKDVNAYMSQFESPSEDDDTPDDIHKNDLAEYITIIDADEYDTETEFSQTSLTYYDEDGIVCDENETVVDDVEDLIGNDVLHTFGQNPLNPENVVYVRNNWTETVYEITLIHNAYGRVVLGINDDFEMYMP